MDEDDDGDDDYTMIMITIMISIVSSITVAHSYIISYHALTTFLPSSEQQLHDAFQSYGVIADVTCPQPLMVSEQTSDSNIGHAFIRYKDRRDMAAAMSDVMDGKVLINGHTIEGEVVPPSYWPSERTRRYY